MASISNTNHVNLILREKILLGGGSEFTIVLLAIDKGPNRPTEFSTHVHRVEDNSIANGNYFTGLDQAIIDYEKRM